MKIQRFFVNKKIEPGVGFVIDDKDQTEQIRRVFRKKVGDTIGLLDNSGLGYEAKIVDFGKNVIACEVGDEKINTYIPKKEIWLCVSIIKKDKFEWVVEKATELGVSHIVPVISERTEKTNLNIERLNKIAKEASEQSERGVLPTIYEPVELSNCLGTLPENKIVLEIGSNKEVSELEVKTGPLTVFIGPEGGWGEKDLKFFEDNKIEKVSLGEQVLRAETASVAALSLLLLE